MACWFALSSLGADSGGNMFLTPLRVYLHALGPSGLQLGKMKSTKVLSPQRHSINTESQDIIIAK